MTDLKRAQLVLQYGASAIPFASALQCEVESFSDGLLVLTAPLEPNTNDKGTAFAGSLATLAVLTGWVASQLALDSAEIDSGDYVPTVDVAVMQTEMRYQKPITKDFYARCHLPIKEALQRSHNALLRKSRTKLSLFVELGFDDDCIDNISAEFSGSYAVVSK